MPDIASVLKQEIARLARKEVRAQTELMRKTVGAYRSEIASLKQRVAALEKQAKQSARVKPAPVAPVEPGRGKHRFSAKGLATHRQRLGLSAADYGKLVGASGLSVYKWEGGQAHPRARYLPVLTAVRKLGKREAMQRLGQLAA